MISIHVRLKHHLFPASSMCWAYSASIISCEGSGSSIPSDIISQFKTGSMLMSDHGGGWPKELLLCECDDWEDPPV